MKKEKSGFFGSIQCGITGLFSYMAAGIIPALVYVGINAYVREQLQPMTIVMGVNIVFLVGGLGCGLVLGRNTKMNYINRRAVAVIAGLTGLFLFTVAILASVLLINEIYDNIHNETTQRLLTGCALSPISGYVFNIVFFDSSKNVKRTQKAHEIDE